MHVCVTYSAHFCVLRFVFCVFAFCDRAFAVRYLRYQTSRGGEICDGLEDGYEAYETSGGSL